MIADPAEIQSSSIKSDCPVCGTRDKDRRWFVLVGLLVTVIFLATVSMIFGAYNISLGNVLTVLGKHLFSVNSEVSRLHDTIIWNLRAPRILLAVIVGAALASSGGVFQGCFRNPLVEPYILGVSSGAAFGAALGIVFPGIFPGVAVPAFVMAVIAVCGAYFLARIQGETPVITLILAGVIIGSVFSAMVSIMKYLAEDAALREIVFWLMGGFYYASWKDVSVAGPIVAACLAIQCGLSWKLNVLSMGDEEARSLGVNPEYCKLILIITATLATAVSVASVGVIAWVGLMMPHAARMILGPDHRYVIPASALLGSAYLILSDTLARNLTGAEIPIGIMTSILGAPYLFYLLRAKGRTAFGV